jgi:pyridinium-3,5-bisthiocarboxylic acid mononucleotide nickel chelatase
VKKRDKSVRIAYFDCFSGISGDMTLGALIDLGVPLEAIQSGISSMGLTDVRITSEIVKKAGFRAVHVKIEHPEQKSHRHLHQIEEMIERGTEIAPDAKLLAKRIFGLIGEAEAKMHNTTIRKVHFHEVGAIDSIVDIVGVAIGFQYLGIERVESSPVPTGCGSIQIDHGLVSIPAPATAELLIGIPIAASTIEKELTTPTGAAILKATVQQFGPLPAMNLTAIGYGAGTYDLPGQPNVLRIALGESDRPTRPTGAIPLEHDRVVVLETNIDDSTAEDLADCSRKLMEAGALDVFQTPCVMKKGRSGVLLTVICSVARVESLEGVLFTESSTIGIRRYTADRDKLIRRNISLETSLGAVSAKVVQLAAGQSRMTVEYEDARDLAAKRQTTLAEVRQAAANAWEAHSRDLITRQP